MCILITRPSKSLTVKKQAQLRAAANRLWRLNSIDVRTGDIRFSKSVRVMYKIEF